VIVCPPLLIDENKQKKRKRPHGPGSGPHGPRASCPDQGRHAATAVDSLDASLRREKKWSGAVAAAQIWSQPRHAQRVASATPVEREAAMHVEGGRGSPRCHATGGAPPPDPTAPMPDPPPAATLLLDLASGGARVEEKGMEEGCRARQSAALLLGGGSAAWGRKRVLAALLLGRKRGSGESGGRAQEEEGSGEQWRKQGGSGGRERGGWLAGKPNIRLYTSRTYWALGRARF